MTLTAPQTPADALPPLVITICQVCDGTGGDEGYDGSAIRCEYCNGYGCTEVCEGCGLTPTVRGGFDSCGCTVCELCGNPGSLNSAEICEACHEQYETELETARACFESDEAEEVAWGRSIGWLA